MEMTMDRPAGQLFAPAPLAARIPVWALALLVAAAVVLAVLAAAHALAAQGRVAGWPADGLTLANTASRLAAPALTGAGPGEAAPIAMMARQALALEPTADRALSALALLEQSRDPDRALALHRLARRLTRRNAASSLVLAQEELAQRRFAEALGELGQLLRVEPRLRQELMSQIVQLLQDDAAIAPLAAMLRRERGWSDEFWQAAPDFRPGLGNLVALRRSLQGTPGAVHPRHDEFLLQALVNDGRFAQAEALATQLVPGFAPDPQTLLRNAGFDAPPRGRPFDWRLFPTATASVFHDVASGTLTISAMPGPGGVVASQLVRLPADRPVLDHVLKLVPAAGGAAGADLLEIEIACAGSPLANRREFTGAQALAGVAFAPLPGCRYHLVTLRLAARTAYPAGDIVLDAITIRAPGR